MSVKNALNPRSRGSRYRRQSKKIQAKESDDRLTLLLKLVL